MSETNILYQKEGFTIIKKATNNYNLSFTMQNNNIILSKIIDFNLVKLIYDLNSDIYEKINIQHINENEVKINFLMKHLFEDLGLPQRFSYMYMSKVIEDNCIKFISQTIKNERPDGMPCDSELLPIQNMDCNCKIIDNHVIQFSCNIVFDSIMIVPPIAEKMVGLILYKIFYRVKQFIENIRM